MTRLLVGFILGLACIPAAAYYWYSHTQLPVAVADQPFPNEREIAGKLLNDRISKEMVQIPPIQPDEHTLVAGAQIYSQKCAVCHGFHDKPSAIGQSMYPAAPPLWEKHHNSSVVGVSDDAPGETYWKVVNGIRLTGMPEYKTQLNDTEIWEVSLLLAHADKPLPPTALTILHGDSGTTSSSTHAKEAEDPTDLKTLDE
jgi:thiosulfate dehydrogenase